MKKHICIILLAALLLAACVPTPEEPPVLQKDQDLMIQQGSATLSPEQPYTPPEVPERYQYDYQEGTLTVHADAAVTVPNGSLPMARVRAQGFEQEAVRRLFKLLANGETAVLRRLQPVATKEQITVELESAMQMLEDGSYKAAGITETEWKEHIADLKDAYKKAPFETEQPENEISDGTFYKQQVSGVMVDYLEAYTESGVFQAFSAEDANDAPSMFEYMRVNMPNYSMNRVKEIFADSEQTDKIDLSFSDAMTKAQEIIDTIGEPLIVTHVYVIDDAQNGNTDGIVSDAKHWAYYLQCQRQYRGITIATGRPGISSTSDTYAIMWQHETMKIILDDNGIEFVQWEEPLTVTEVISETSNLMPFSSISEIAQRMLRVIYIENTNAQNDSTERHELAVNVKNVRLELIRIRQQDSADRKIGVLVPAWVFYGKIMKTDYHENETVVSYAGYGGKGRNTYGGDEIILCINAIDGTVIDPLLGY